VPKSWYAECICFLSTSQACEALMGEAMSCDYRIQGHAIVRNTPEVMLAINELTSAVIGEDYLTVIHVDSNTLELSIDYDDITTIHTPAHVGSFLETIAPAVIGCGVFDIETSGDRWTEWIGEEQAIKESKSRTALSTIKDMIRDLLQEDLARCMEYIQEQNGNARS
jgi:hypothetical protein